MQTAPVRPRDPPASITSPEVNLVEAATRPGASPSTPSEIKPPAAPAGAPGGIPIAATRSSPVCALPGAIQWPSLAAWKLTVESARTATPVDLPRRRVDPRGDVGRDHGRAAAR